MKYASVRIRDNESYRKAVVVYVKLFSQILDSSIWLESGDTRIVWITLLAAMDQDGFARFAMVENLARRANVSNEACSSAVSILESPDPNSSDDSNEGRRIERVPGGWLVLNSQKYRELGSAENRRERVRGYVQKHREKAKANVSSGNQDVISSKQVYRKSKHMQKQKQKQKNVDLTALDVTIVESAKAPTSTRQQTPVEEVFQFWQEQTKHPLAKLTPKRFRKIQARLQDGYSLSDLQTAVRGCATSPFHQGDNDDGRIYDDIELICRDGEHVEQFINLTAQGDTGNGQTIRRNASRVETTSERRRRETAELCAALEADPIDSAKQIVSRPPGNGSH
jgi:hypothetical protein